MHRRTYLAAVGTAVTGTLAGCGAGDGSTATPDDAPSPTDTPAGIPPTETPAGTPSPTDTPTDRPGGLRNPSFEDGLDGWDVGQDLPEDPNNPGQPVDAAVRATTDRANTGASSVEMRIDGSADDGTVWVAQGADFAGAERLAVHCYSPEQTFNLLAELAVYTGPMPEGGSARTSSTGVNRPATTRAGNATSIRSTSPERGSSPSA